MSSGMRGRGIGIEAELVVTSLLEWHVHSTRRQWCGPMISPGISRPIDQTDRKAQRYQKSHLDRILFMELKDKKIGEPASLIVT